MAEVLITLQNCCAGQHSIESEKVTERKKQIEILKRELNKPKVLQQLDKNSDANKGVTWEWVYQFVMAYMAREADAIQKPKGGSSSSLAGRDRKKQEVGAVYKMFVSKANQQGEHLTCESMVHHVLTMLKDEFCCEAFGVQCCGVLLREILSSRKYCCDIKPKYWDDLLTRIGKLLLNTDCRISNDLLARTMHTLMSRAVVQGFFRCKPMFSFFTHTLNGLKTERSALVTEQLLGAANKFCQYAASDCRGMLCKLGEDCLLNLLHVWKIHVSQSQTIKDELIEFFRLQMKCHHPQGVLTEDTGVYAVDIDIWKSHLRKLYELLYEDWKQAGSRLKMKGSGTSREMLFKPNYVDLAADICHQIFADDTSSLEVTQVATQSTSQNQGSVKRRKLESGWQMLRDYISQHGNYNTMIPWLQLLRALLAKFPASLPEPEYIALLTALHQAQIGCKRAEVQSWLLLCLCALARSQEANRDNLYATTIASLNVDWIKVWNAAIRTINLHSAEAEAFDLLTYLLHHGIVQPDKDHWRLFTPGCAQPASNSLRFLAACLKYQHIPENFMSQPSMLGSSADFSKGNYPLRHQLLYWLLPVEEEIETGERPEVAKYLKNFSASFGADVLVSLTQKIPRHSGVDHKGTLEYNSENDEILTTQCKDYKQREELYLQSTFDLPVSNDQSHQQSVDKTVKKMGYSVVASVKLKLMQRLILIGNQLLETVTKDASHLECLVQFACLLWETLNSLLQHGVIDSNDVKNSEPVRTLQSIMKRVATFIKEYQRSHDSGADKSRTHTLSLILDTLVAMLQRGDSSGTEDVSGQSIIYQALMIPEVADVLMQLVVRKKSHSIQTNGQRPSRARRDPFDDDDDMAMDLDDEFDGAQNNNDMDLFDAEVTEDSGTSGYQSLLSQEQLSEQEQLALKSAQLISTWCLLAARALEHGQHKGKHVATEPDDLMEKLMDIFQSESWDKSKSFDAQLLFTVAEPFTLAELPSRDYDLLILLDTLWNLTSSHRWDQEVVTEILRLVSRLVTRLASTGQMVSSDLQEAREKVMHLMGVIWKLQSQDKYCKSVRLAMAKWMEALVSVDPQKLQSQDKYCKSVRFAMAKWIESLISVDPHSQWTTLKKARRDDDDDDDDNDPSVADKFPLLLGDGSHQIRMYMTRAVKCLFSSRKGKDVIPFSKEIQDGAFDVLYQTAQDAMELKGKITVEEQNEEGVNRTASLLSVLASVSRFSPVCEKKALFALIQAIRLNSIEIAQMMKVHSRFSPVCEKKALFALIQAIRLNGIEIAQMMKVHSRFSPVCEKKALFALIQAIRLNGIEIAQMMKVLEHISSSLKYPSADSFMESHLKFLVHQWLQEEYLLSEFPFSLLGCVSEGDFYSKYHTVIIPDMVADNNLDLVQAISDKLNFDPADLIRHSFPQSIAQIIPMYAHTRSAGGGGGDADQESQKVRKGKAIICLKSLSDIFGQEVIDGLIQSNLDQIVVALLSMLYEPHTDDSDLAQFTSDNDPEPNPPFFNSYTVRATMDYLTKCHGTSAHTLVSLLAKIQDNIQKILLALHVSIVKAHRHQEKHRLLLGYRLFVRLLLRELSSKLGGSWAFVLQDVIYTVVHTITSAGDSSLVLPCVDIMQTLCETALDCCPAELGKHLQVIMGCLVPVVERSDDAGKMALSLVNSLVIQNGGKLKSTLQYLDPLPDSAKLAKARQAQDAVRYQDGEFNLLEEINHFLHGGGQSDRCQRLEGLKQLRIQLMQNKEELALLVAQCAETKKEERKEENVLVKLICTLVQLCDGSGDNDASDNHSVRLLPVREEAARCLGEIGAANLSTIALRVNRIEDDNASYSTALEIFDDNPTMRRHVVIVHLLKGYLIDSNVDTVEAAAGCLKNALSTQAGVKCYEVYKEKNIDTLFSFLYPFRPNKRKISNTSNTTCSDAHFKRIVGDSSLWQPIHGKHDDWVRNLTVALISCGAVRDEMMSVLQPICKVKVEFAERVLPYLIHDILATGIKDYRDVLSEQVGALFGKHCESLSSNSSRAPTPLPNADTGSTSLSLKSVQVMLDVVHYLRTQQKPSNVRSKGTAWDNNFWLDLNYLEVAKAAQSCRAHFTCLLYAEIWCDVQRSRLSAQTDSADSLPSSQPSDVETLSSLSSESSINMQSLLLEAYSSIGEPDGLYGCGAGKMTDTMARIHTYEHERSWGKALGAYDIYMATPGGMTPDVGILQAMQNFGLGHVLNIYLQGLRSCDMAFDLEVTDFQYEAAWKNGVWDLELEDRSQAFSGYHKSIYTALTSLKDAESDSFEVALQQARQHTIENLCHVSMESAHSVYPLLSRLQGLADLESFAPLILSNQTELSNVLRKWKKQLPIMENDFEFLEPTLALRTVLLQTLLEKSNSNQQTQVLQGLVGHLQTQAEMARNAKHYQIAERAMTNLQQLNTPGQQDDENQRWHIESAKIFWCRGEKESAMHIVKSLVDKLGKNQRSSVRSSLYPEALTVYGNWLAETCAESPIVITEGYLEKAVDIYEAQNDSSRPAIEAYLSLARFADTQYQNIVNYMKSNVYQDKKALLLRSQRDLEAVRAVGETANISRYVRTLQKQGEIDQVEVLSLDEDKKNFLHKAVDCYLRCLAAGDPQHDIRVFRLCSLWFSNSGDRYVNSKIAKEGADTIESHKYLPLLYQLAARMTTKTQDREDFHQVLNKLIEKCAVEHPHHVLPIILALANANKDAIINAPKKGRLARTGGDSSHADEDRMEAAQMMLERLQSSRCGRILSSMEKLSDAYIKLAYWDVSQYKKETRKLKLPSNQPITQLKHLQNVAMPTLDLPVDPHCRYDNIVYVEGFDSGFKLAGGINLPKILTCIGSDGVERRQLVKGKDDLRQDAVMQQVFGLVNKLLQRNQETRRRSLQIRTYRVIPLSQRSGILEWCEGTMPLGEYLIGNQRSDYGAHKRYQPHDWTSMECRKKMSTAHSSGDQTKRYRDYVNVMKHFQPVFRHFFLEKFPEPATWFERRLAYTRSVATCSIVGYVVGLGDRHVQNILIDCNTAELVHIDLGVAFEQGRILPTPETIPFRLTRDLVDGMGVAGVEGVYRRCCEKTMELMHNAQESLLTILEVLLYDPLYVWTMSPAKAMELQQQRDRADPEASELNTSTAGDRDFMDGGAALKGQDRNEAEANKMAERVLLRLGEKLRGVEDGVSLSVNGQVNRLIQEARDPKNLCRVFPGWQPWV
ncbi:serine-protein kinase ATM-like [Amphiura filiformis]|uniref:serine-protein kinase ATM-like n=1 Tax=Amphiura filiformis TaxID=82378 RepID=UPI003B2263C3